jgi:diguanylate cyclase (GGDEF)-like protein
VVVECEGTAGLAVSLDREVTLGRDPACDVVLPSEDVSRRHARVSPDGDGHLLVDLGSTNGTHVNGWQVGKRRLVSGDRIQVGPFTIRYFTAGALEARDLEEVGRLARRDPLTGVANRRAFEEALAKAFAQARRTGMSLSVVAADVDHFKKVNDRMGHPAGDAVIAAVAGRLGGALRDGDLVARVGGEEFAVLLPGAGLAEAVEIAGRLRVRVAEAPINVPGGAVAVTVSLGCAALLAEDEEPVSLLARADAKLYEAKIAGRDRVMS